MVIAIVIVMLLSVFVMQHSVLPLRLADMRATTCVLKSYAVQTVGSRDHPWPFSSLIMQSNSMMLIPHLPKGILRMVNEFAGRCRGDLCNEGTAIAVKSAGVSQYWCIDYGP